MRRDQDMLVLPSEAPELSNKALIPGRQGHESCPSTWSPGPAALCLDEAGEHVPCATTSGLGKLGLLGKGIIPPSRLVTPHPPNRQNPVSPAPIRAGSLGPSRESTGGDHKSPAAQTPGTMIFTDLYKSPRSTFNKLRSSLPHGVPPPPDIDPDLVSRDKAKQKEAVKRHLAEKIRNDWEFTWPPVVAAAAATAEPTIAAQDGVVPPVTEGDVTNLTPVPETADGDPLRDAGEEADSDSDAESTYSTISEDPERFRPRAEWTSDLSDNDDFHVPTSPFRFDSPEAVGAAVRDSIESKRAQRRKAVREEAKWNPGLACFEARRNAWTGARIVRVKPKPPNAVSPTSARRFFWRHSRTESTVISSSPPSPTSPLQPTATRTSTTTASESDSGKSATYVQKTASHNQTPSIPYPVETVIPIPPPLLPPQNPMRASIQPSMYGSLYDKVVVQSMQPSCPVNLSDMLRACVVGWKRDGEWPPKSSYPAPASSQTAAITMRQRKAQQQRSKNAAASASASAAGNGSGSRRLSLVGFFNGTSRSAVTTQEVKDKDKEGKENGLDRSQSHSSESAGSPGKTLFRRSLHRVLSLGQHGHGAHGSNGNGEANGAGMPLSPTSPTTKEGTAAS
ncbi:uncharacterized protein B0T15DRAFT_233004 [Chaetomium strumarium]|uniref:Gag1-like clamp domain-containing protein n=1 Tax=Chaetomium strumarium TaxID=1170767 RepID=A0AAJ0GQC8_9PEZI|nr:hypothetical protein B0T15DRAFT_233004 [Chaetomium strumarium]